MSLEQIDVIAGWASLVFTLMIFSYLLADNFLYRIATHVFIGAAAAFVAISAIEDVVIPWINTTLIDPDPTQEGLRVLGMVPFIISMMLIFKSTKAFPRAGNLANAVLIGTGTAVALVGALVVTVFPLIEATGRSVNEESAIDAFVLMGGTICTLLYFQYVNLRRADGTIRRFLPLQFLASLGHGVIAVTLGALYAGVLLTSLNIFSTIINDQIRFILEQLGG